MKTVIHISVSAGAETTGALALSLARHAAANGWKAVVAYGRAQAPAVPDVEFYHIGSLAEQASHLLKRRILGAAARGSRHATARLIKFLKKLNPDVVHLHNLHGYFLDVQMLLEYLAHSRAHVVFTLHDRWATTGRCAIPGDCPALEAGCTACPCPDRYPATRRPGSEGTALQRKISTFSKLSNLTVVGVSDWISALARASHLGIHPVLTIPNGTAVPLTEPQLHREKKILLVAHKWTREKGADRLRRLRQLLPQDIGMEIIGRNADSFITAGDCCGPCVIHGHLPHAQVIKEMEQAAALVILSRHESFSMTKIEALVQGTPVAALDCEGIREGVEDIPGVAIAEDLETLVRKIITLVEETTDKDRNVIATVARNRFSIQTMSQRYLHLYTKN